MTSPKATIAFTTSLFFLGCTATYKVTRPQKDSTEFPRTASFFIAVPQDGRFESINYPGSGQKTAVAVAEALGRHAARMEPAIEAASFEQSLAAASRRGYDHLVHPTFIRWEDRATEWY